jgi:HK97 family phage prohead protease
MSPEYKVAPQFTKEISDRLVVGIFAVHGNVDEGGDRSHPGSFANTKVAGRDRVRFLWQHNSNETPIAVVKSVRELTRDQLPETVRAYAPEATGGVEVAREYLDTPRGNEVLAGIKAGAIEEMSYAYELSAWRMTDDEERGMIREIDGVRLFDISDVNWGMNPATVAAKGLNWKVRPLTDHARAVEAEAAELVERVKELLERREKEARVFSTANFSALTSVADVIGAAHAELRDILKRGEPQKAQPTPDKTEMRRLWLDYQRTIAHLNGVPRS